RLPDRSLSVTFDLTALASSLPLAHVTSATIDVPARTIQPLTVAFSVPLVEDMAIGDLATTGAQWTLERGAPPPGPGAIRGLWASSGSDVYAASTDYGGANL